MTMEELKALLEKANANLKAQQEKNEAMELKFKTLETQQTELLGKFDKLKQGGDADEAAELANQIKELQSEMSDIRTKQKQPGVVLDTKAEKEAFGEICKKAVGQWLQAKNNGTPTDLFKFVATDAAEHFKALNITNADEGGRAVAEILSRDVIEYAREYSPILNYIGRKPEMTRNYRELVLVSYPSVQEGIENVPGTTIAQTSTQEYKEVRSKVFKVNAKPRITDEALYAPDINIYAGLVRLLGREMAIYTAAQVLYGNGLTKNARGILSSNRVQITDETGQSFKPTLAPDPDNARNADYYPVKPTGVAGQIGADDKAIVDYVIDVVNSLPTEHLNGAQWFMTRKTRGIFEKVRDAEDRPIFRMSYIDGVGRMLLNGFPVVIDDTLPELATNASFAIFGRLDRAFALNDGDIDKMLLDPYTVDGCTLIKTDKEYFEMVQMSDAIIVCNATTNGPA